MYFFLVFQWKHPENKNIYEIKAVFWENIRDKVSFSYIRGTKLNFARFVSSKNDKNNLSNFNFLLYKIQLVKITCTANLIIIKNVIFAEKCTIFTMKININRSQYVWKFLKYIYPILHIFNGKQKKFMLSALNFISFILKLF